MKSPSWLPRILVESGLIVLSILLALAASEWWEERERQAELDVALSAIRSELRANAAELREVERYHQALEDTLRALHAAGATRVPGDAYPRGLVRGAAISATAWQTARATGLLNELPFDAVLALSRAYETQASYLEQKSRLLHLLYEEVFREGIGLIDRRYPQFAGIISDVAGWERGLLQQYATALARLDSLAR